MVGMTRRCRDTPLKSALKCLCGPAAEAFYSDGSFGREECKIDIADAARYARNAGVSLDLVWHQAMALVDHHQSDIEVLANALLDHGCLGAMEVEVVLGESWSSPMWL